MKTFISILRGINVSGQKKILMADLKALYESLNYKNVRTYVQSGNVVFETADTDPKEIARQIEQKIQDKYGFPVPVIIRTLEELETAVQRHIFFKQDGTDTDKLYVTFLADQPAQANLDKMSAFQYAPDEYKIIDQEVYIFCPGGYGNTKLSNTFFENKLKVTATTRNWKTVNELIKMA